MAKFCVFCGGKPDKKNKEHIIPKWLIKLTGDENRTISLGVNFNHIFHTGEIDFDNRYFSFNSFQFPACATCNSEYSSFENNASIVVKKILNGDFVDTPEINIMLDWFDKVRIGLWLGSITLDKITEDVSPKFYINNRIGKKDRSLYIYKLSVKVSKGINFHGYNTPGFQFAPCVFGLRINDYFFINYSNDFLTSKNLGFPYCEYVGVDENSRADLYKNMEGLNRIITPIIKNDFIRPTFAIYQAILDIQQTPKEHINDYVLENSSKFYSDRSAIFYYDSLEKKIQKLSDDDEIIIEGKEINNKLKTFNKITTKKVFEELENILRFNRHMKIEDKEKSSIIEGNRKLIMTLHRLVKTVWNYYIRLDIELNEYYCKLLT